MVDAANGTPLYATSKIVERNGMRVAFLGLLGKLPFNALRENADFDVDAWKDQQRVVDGAGGRRELQDLSHRLAKASSAKDDKAKQEILELMKSLQVEQSAVEQTPVEPPPYDGPRFRITDAVESARKELAALAGKYDLAVAIAHMDKDETEALRKAMPELDFIVDGHGELKSQFAPLTEGAPHVLRAGSRGRSLSLVEITLVGGLHQFENMGDRDRAKSGLERQKKLWDRLVKEADGKDPLQTFDEKDRRYKRAARTKQLMDEYEAQLNKNTSQSWFQLKTLNLGSNITPDPALKDREDRLEPPDQRGH